MSLCFAALCLLLLKPTMYFRCVRYAAQEYTLNGLNAIHLNCYSTFVADIVICTLAVLDIIIAEMGHSCLHAV